MLALIQRVSSARVDVADEVVGAINAGLLVLLGIEKEDGPEQVDRLLKKVLAYRVFEDGEGKMNLSLADTRGGLLIVSQFTLAADTTRGLRPSFSSAKTPVEAEQLYDLFVKSAQNTHGQQQGGEVACGRFGANMQVSLVNDGPVTFLLHT